MGYAIGMLLAVFVGVFARLTGFDRDRAFYPTVLIIVPSYYVLFAILGDAPRAVAIESVFMAAVMVLAVAGFKVHPGFVVLGLAGHGVLDVFHDGLVTNPGVPVWWPAFCMSIDVGLAVVAGLSYWRAGSSDAGRLQGGRAAAKPVTIALLGLLVFASSAEAADQRAACGVATFEDVQVVTATVPQATITTMRDERRKPGERQRVAVTTPSESTDRKYQVTVRLNGLVYTGESSGNWFWDFNPTRFVINDPVQACVSNGRLTLKRPDGKDYKLKIVRVVRDGGHERRP